MLIEVGIEDKSQTNLVGEEKGKKVRDELMLSQYEDNFPTIVFVFPEGVIGVTYSYFKGLFEGVKKVCPTIQDFLAKYIFKCDPYLLKGLSQNLNRLYSEK